MNYQRESDDAPHILFHSLETMDIHSISVSVTSRIAVARSRDAVVDCDSSMVPVRQDSADTQLIAAHKDFTVLSSKRDSCLLLVRPVAGSDSGKGCNASLRCYKYERIVVDEKCSQVVSSFDINPLNERQVIAGASSYSLLVRVQLRRDV